MAKRVKYIVSADDMAAVVHAVHDKFVKAKRRLGKQIGKEITAAMIARGIPLCNKQGAEMVPSEEVGFIRERVLGLLKMGMDIDVIFAMMPVDKGCVRKGKKSTPYTW